LHPPKNIQHAFDVLVATQCSITDSGSTPRAIFAAATRPRKRHGLPFPYANVDPSVGPGVHERPTSSPYEDIVHTPGMMAAVNNPRA
jgi:hypothetical protein